MRFEPITGSAPLFREPYRCYVEELRSFEPKVPPFDAGEYRSSVRRNPSLFIYFIRLLKIYLKPSFVMCIIFP